MFEDSLCKLQTGRRSFMAHNFKRFGTECLDSQVPVKSRYEQYQKIGELKRREVMSPTAMLSSPLPNSVEGASLISFKDFRLRWALKKMMRKLHGLIVPSNNSNPDATEEWEKRLSSEIEEERESRWLLRQSDWLSRLLQPITTLFYILICWYVSVDVVMGIGSMNQPTTAAWIAVLAVDVCQNLNTVRLRKGKSLRTRWAILREYLRRYIYLDAIILTYIIGKSLSTNEEFELALHIVVFVAVLAKLRRKIELLRAYFAYKKFVVMIESLFLLLVASHFSVTFGLRYALALYLSSKFVPEKCWLGYVGIQGAGWAKKYIYSLYWAVSTIVTVGYGDITPQNYYEVAVTILIELCGSALFGYLINVIGATMSELKKENENLQEELGIAERLVKCLSLNDDLAYRLSSYLKDNQKADTYFSLNDEKRIWDKLKPDLKQCILQQTNIRVIKKCLFFLTYFSSNLQDTIALKLVKRVFQPNERLGIDAASHSFYIIDQGKADLQMSRVHFNKLIHKTLRIINREPQKDKHGVTSNLFGFTSVLLRRRVNLTALSKEFIVTYELEEKEFDELVSQYPSDFETVCQLRDNILHTDVPESYEGPELLDPSMHFVPVRRLIMRRHVQSSSQMRRHKCRSNHRSIYRRHYFLEFNDAESFDFVDKRLEPRRSSILTNLILNMVVTKAKAVKEEDSIEEEVDDKAMDNFEQAKSYSKYFVASNIERILRRFNPAERKPTVFRRLKQRKEFSRSIASENSHEHTQQ